MLLVLVPLLCGVHAAGCCLQCDSSIVRMHENFILSAPTVNDQIELQDICDYAYVTYQDTSKVREGVIGKSSQCSSVRISIMGCLLLFFFSF